MKIAVFHNLPPGGAKRGIYKQAKYLAKKHELHLFELASSDEKFLDLKPLVAKSFLFDFKIKSSLPSFLARLERDFQNFVQLALVHKKISEQIDAGNYDAVLVHSDKFTESPFILRFLKTPSAYYSHELLRIVYEKQLMFKEKVVWPKKFYELATRRLRKIIDKRNASSANVILTNSQFIQKKIKKAYNRKAIICYPGVDTQVFQPGSKRKEKKVLFIGNRIEIEGYDLAKQALDLMSTELRPKLEVLDFSLGQPRIKDDKGMVHEYSTSLATLCLDYSEPFGLKAIESMACETPVLAVNEGGYKETVLDKKTGYLLKRNPQELAQKIVYLIRHPLLAKRMGKAGRKHVVKNFSWSSQAKCIEKALRKISRK